MHQKRGSPISGAGGDLHGLLSQSEIAGGKRISRHLSGGKPSQPICKT